jgi:hypothetical protein
MLKKSIFTFILIIFGFQYSYAVGFLENEINLLQKEILKNQELIKSSSSDSDVRDLKILKTYSEALHSLTDDEKTFLEKVIRTIKEYRGKPIIAEKTTSGDVDGDGVNDEIISRVYEENGSIKGESVWKKDKMVLWQYTIENPYLYISPSKLFEFGTRDIWVIFTISIDEAIPKLIEPFHNDDPTYFVELGIDALNKKGIKTSKEQYGNYLKNFKGKMLQYGEPESGGELDIWYPPAKQFIQYYTP